MKREFGATLIQSFFHGGEYKDPQTRRKRKTMNYAELAKEEAPQHKPTHVVRLPFMQPFQVAVVFGREA